MSYKAEIAAEVAVSNFGNKQQQSGGNISLPAAIFLSFSFAAPNEGKNPRTKPIQILCMDFSLVRKKERKIRAVSQKEK